MKNKKYLFIYLKTGGGHLAPARAVSDYFKKGERNPEIMLVDGFAKSGRLVKMVIEDGYRVLQDKAQWIYELIYAIHKLKIVSLISSSLVSIFVKNNLRKIILEEKPDKIVIFHFFVIASVYTILREEKINIPVIAVVTDPYSPHPIWFLNKNQTFIVFSDLLKKKCTAMGIDATRLHLFPFIIDDKYSRLATEEDKNKYRKELGFSAKRMLLILGGGDGIPKGIQIIKKILKGKWDYEIAFVCGRNRELYDKVRLLEEKMKTGRVKIYGYTDLVYKLISISDLVITKCGASTFMEILISRKIPIVNNYIWEQENGNVKFLVDNDIGIYEKRIGKLPGIVNSFFSDQSRIDRVVNKIASLDFKNGLSLVADFIKKYEQ